MARISHREAPERATDRAAQLRSLLSRRRAVVGRGRRAIAPPLSAPVPEGKPGVFDKVQSLFNFSYEELRRQRDEAAQKAEEAGRLRQAAIERERDAALEKVRQLAQENARLREALARINHPPHNNYEAHLVARAALAKADGADVPYPTN